jgi:beta-galactosidase
LKGKPVTEQKISSNKLPEKLIAYLDSDQILANGSDMTRLVFKLTDQFGNPLPYTRKIISFKLEGPAEFVGDNPFLLFGGQGAVYIKANNKPGMVKIKVSTSDLEPVSISLELT